MASSSNDSAQERSPRLSQDSLTSVSTTSIVFDRIHEETEEGYVLGRKKETRGQGDLLAQDPLDDGDDSETGAFLASSFAGPRPKPMERSLRRLLIILATLFVGVWVVALLVFVSSGSYKHASELEHDPEATFRGSAKPIAIDQLFDGTWSAKTRPLEWIAGPGGEDGLLLEKGAEGKDYLVVEDVRTTVGNHSDTAPVAASRTLMKAATFAYAGQEYRAARTWPSPDLRTVLIAVDVKRVWRHSFTAVYFVLDVATQTAQPLVPTDALARVQLATWSPQSDAIAYTRDNNLFLRRLGDAEVVQVTRDGGPEYFYGIPDWVYEEEVWAARSATWWSDDGKYLAFVATNETGVAEYTLQHFLSRPSLTEPAAGEESYPELRRIKYPKAGSHNPVVEVRFYDVARGDSFAVPLEDDFADDDRIINDLLWAGDKVLLKTTNRVSDVLKVMLIDVAARQGRTVRTTDVGQLDGGWFEISHAAKYVPADPARGRPLAGYVDQVIHEGFEHLAYFSPLDAQTPTMLTSGAWEVDAGPSAVDLSTNTVYFVAAKESSTTRHVYSVSLLGGSEPVALTDTSSDAYYSVSFSAAAGYALLHYEGPKTPWQRVVSTPRNPTRYEASVEDNAELAALARTHALPLKRYGTITLPADTSTGSLTLNYLELRPRHFSPNKKHPVLYYQYSGPGSQTVTKKFAVDFQSYVASTLGYIVIIVDPRGTGFLGRPHRVAVRSRLGQLEALDHIAAARHFAKLHYIDGSRFCIWGWSYGGFQALKTLEVDAGETFAYGMAVAPVTDWRFYDSIYSERYMLTPQQNPAGYEAAAVTNASALARVKRFMVMHGVADDNVHVQNSLTLFDHLDAARVENYDVHVFADSDHSIMFHDANRVVFDKMSNWLVNAFNGEWLKTEHAKPIDGRR